MNTLKTNITKNHCDFDFITGGKDEESCPTTAPPNPNSCDNLNVDPFQACGSRVFNQAIINNPTSSRVVGGTMAARGAYPWQVKFY